MVAWGWGWEWECAMDADRHKRVLGSDRNVLEVLCGDSGMTLCITGNH